MAATIVTHMMISLNSHVGRASNRNANFKKVSTIQQFENVTEVKYKSVIEQEQLPESGAQFYQYNLNESAIAISEISLAEVKKAVRTLTESATAITEALVHTVKRTITESNTAITEGLTSIKKPTRILSEPTTNIGESIQKSVNRPKTITEPATAITEDLQAHKLTLKTLTPESITISETSLDRIVKKVRELIETPTDITEALTHLKSTTLTESPITITEELAKSRLFSFILTPEKVNVKGSTYSFVSNSFTTASYVNSPDAIDILRKTVTHQLTQVTSITENLLSIKRLVHSMSESVPLGQETISRLVSHFLSENTSITESLSRIRRPSRLITEDHVELTESPIDIRRVYQRVINPDSFTPDSFTTGIFESFKMPNEDAIEITEELEAFVLPGWQKVIIEDPTVITESLVALKIPAIIPPVVGGGGGGGKRRRRRSYPPLYQRRQPPPEEPPELIREPILYQFELTEPAIQITEALYSTKIITQIQTKIQTISVAAAVPPPQIIEKTVYVDRIVEKEVQPPPIIRAQDVIVSKPKPIEIEQEILVSTQAYSDKLKSKTASAKLEVLQRLAMLSELEELI